MGTHGTDFNKGFAKRILKDLIMISQAFTYILIRRITPPKPSNYRIRASCGPIRGEYFYRPRYVISGATVAADAAGTVPAARSAKANMASAPGAPLLPVTVKVKVSPLASAA